MGTGARGAFDAEVPSNSAPNRREIGGKRHARNLTTQSESFGDLLPVLYHGDSRRNPRGNLKDGGSSGCWVARQPIGGHKVANMCGGEHVRSVIGGERSESCGAAGSVGGRIWRGGFGAHDLVLWIPSPASLTFLASRIQRLLPLVTALTAPKRRSTNAVARCQRHVP
eukprot:scaffold1659_cov255-Pinguiococcus_pyrenoidosus.AAC.7